MCAITDIVVFPPGIISDHSLITFRLPITKSKPSPVARRHVRNWKNFDLDKFQFDLSNSLLCSSLVCNSLDVNYLVCLYTSILSELVSKHAPLITITVSERAHNAPWFDSECRIARTKVRKLERHYRSAKTDRLKYERIALWSAAHKAMLKTYRDKEASYWESQINENANNSSKLWSVFSSILQRDESSKESAVLEAQVLSDYFVDKISTLRSSFTDSLSVNYPSRSPSMLSSFESVTPEHISSLISKCPNKSCSLDPVPTWVIKKCPTYFSPILAAICNASIHSGVVPSSLKSAIVVPVLKKKNLDANDSKNYRPISNLPFVSKLLERVISSQLTFYLNDNHLLPEC
jgi:hypothetical protein